MQPDQEVFDPRKGYTHSCDPSAEKEARDAYYQGFITAWEHKMLITGVGIITDEGKLRWLNKELPDQLLTKSRMEDIKADHLLGLGDGKTSTQIEE